MSGGAWSDDLLNRRSDAVFLIDFLVRKIEERGKRGGTRSFVLNIDAGWGQGKSYFLENMKTMLEEQQHVVAYVNAWTDDHADDPLIAVMAAIEAAVKKKSAVKAKQPLNKLTQIGGQLAAATVKGLIKQAANRYIGEDALKEMSEAVGAGAAEALKSAGEEASKKAGELYDSEGKALLEKFHVGQRTIKEFREQLSKVVASFKDGAKRPLFILIDELDRCRPTYAVALLERVKHLFDVDDIVFVMATDTDQLKHSIGALYGLNFAAGRYLLRFFDQTYRFESVSVEKFVAQQFLDVDTTKLFGSPHLDATQFCAQTFAAFNLSLRDMQQCTDIIRNCVTVWKDKSQLILLALLPLVILQQQRMEVTYEEVRAWMKNSGVSGRWRNLDFNGWDQSGHRIAFDGSSLATTLIGRACSFNLYKLVHDDDEDATAKVCVAMFAAEARARFPRGLNLSNAPDSLIRTYPQFVRSVGRLSPS